MDLFKFLTGQYFSGIANTSSTLTLIGMIISALLFSRLIVTRHLRIIRNISEKHNWNYSFGKKKLREYVQHTLRQQNTDKEEYITSLKLSKMILNTKEISDKGIFIIGGAGYGKSSLIDYLMYEYCKKQLNLRARSLEERGINFIRFPDILDLEELNKKLDNKNSNILFLDAFDEFNILKDNDTIEVLDKVTKLLLHKSTDYEKIIVTSRLEPIIGGLTSIQKYKFISDEGHRMKTYPFKIIYINLFNSKQILKLYKLQGNNGQPGKNKSRMKEYLKTVDNTIFQIPLFINYADQIFEMLTNEELINLNKETVYDKLIKNWIEREYNKYIEYSGKNRNELSLEKYSNFAMHFIEKIVKYMYDNQTHNISLDNFISIVNEKEYDFNSLITRYLLHQYTNNYYEFIHLSFFEFFTAKIILKESFSIRKKYLENPLYNGIKKFYLNQLQLNFQNQLLNIKQSIINYVHYQMIFNKLETIDDFEKLLNAQSVTIVDNPILSIDQIITLFPLIKEIRFRDYNLNEDQIKELLNNGYLDLNEQKLNNITGLEYFGFIKGLDLSNNNINNIQELIRVYHLKSFTELEYLYITGNPIENLDLLNKVNLRINKLWLTVVDSNKVNEIFRLKNISEFIIDPSFSLDVYIVLCKNLKYGVNIKVSKRKEKLL